MFIEESRESCWPGDGRAWEVDGRAQALVGPGLATPLIPCNNIHKEIARVTSLTAIFGILYYNTTPHAHNYESLKRRHSFRTTNRKFSCFVIKLLSNSILSLTLTLYPSATYPNPSATYPNPGATYPNPSATYC